LPRDKGEERTRRVRRADKTIFLSASHLFFKLQTKGKQFNYESENKSLNQDGIFFKQVEEKV
jgi:hypothetical protein